MQYNYYCFFTLVVILFNYGKGDSEMTKDTKSLLFDIGYITALGTIMVIIALCTGCNAPIEEPQDQNAPQDKTTTSNAPLDIPSWPCQNPSGTIFNENIDIYATTQETGADAWLDNAVWRLIDYNIGSYVYTSTRNPDSSYGLKMGAKRELLLISNRPIDIAYMRIKNHYNNMYAFGDLRIRARSDNSCGLSGDSKSVHDDGGWTTIATATKDTANSQSNGDTTLFTYSCAVTCLDIEMTYNGTGGYGSSPEFYVSEIELYDR